MDLVVMKRPPPPQLLQRYHYTWNESRNAVCVPPCPLIYPYSSTIWLSCIVIWRFLSSPLSTGTEAAPMQQLLQSVRVFSQTSLTFHNWLYRPHHRIFDDFHIEFIPLPCHSHRSCLLVISSFSVKSQRTSGATARRQCIDSV
jgi:hypothetical protein